MTFIPLHAPEPRSKLQSVRSFIARPSSSASSSSTSSTSYSPLMNHAPFQKKSRASLARILLAVCIGFMIMAFAHVHNTNTLRKQPSVINPSIASPHYNSQPLQKPHLKQQQLQQQQQKQQQSLKPSASPSPSPSSPFPSSPPPPSSRLNRPFTTLSQTNLTTKIRFANGTLGVIYKPAFYSDPFGAKKELGSFMKTLASRSWSSSLPSTPEAEGTVQPGSTFFSYLPMGGGNNQFTSLQKAALIAKDLQRTLILPPISPNSHIKVWSGPRYSEFFDLETFSQKSGVPILEWHDLKHTPTEPPSSLKKHWPEFSEDLPCMPNGAIGVDNKNLYDHFRSQFLLNFKSTQPKSDLTAGHSTDYDHVLDLLKDKTSADSDAASVPEMWKCLSCPYFLAGNDLNDRSWSEIGLHLKFNQRIETMADDILDTLLGPASTTTTTITTSTNARRHPEFIIIHLRRGDIVTKCAPGQAEEECIVQIEAIADKVDQIEEQRRRKAVAAERPMPERLPVLVTTNEDRTSELEKIAKLGWILLDHGDEDEQEKAQAQVEASGTTGGPKVKTVKLGTMSTLGPWYPPMLDAVLLTRGTYLIGMRKSRMSQLATQRAAAWYGHKTMLM